MGARCLDEMCQFSNRSVYLNFPGFHEEGDEMMWAPFSPTYERLALKDEYHPSNLFSCNQNIVPSPFTLNQSLTKPA